MAPLLTVIFSLATAVSANLITQGGFESAPCPAPGPCIVNSALAFPHAGPAWTSFRADKTIQLVTPAEAGSVVTGTKAIELNNAHDGKAYSIGQDVPGFVIGQSYELSFTVGLSHGCPLENEQGPRLMYARVGGVNQPSTNFPVTAEKQRHTVRFIAFGTFHGIFLGSLSAGPCGPVVDQVVVAPALQPAGSIYPNILQNADFESGLAAGCEEAECYSTTAAITPWKTTHAPNGEAAINLVRYMPGSGAIALDLNTDQPTQIYQDVNLIPGHRYEVAIGHRQSSGCGDTARTGYVQVLGADGINLVFESFQSGPVWLDATWEFQAGAERSVRVGFGSSEEGNCGPVVDYATLVDLDDPPIGGGVGGHPMDYQTGAPNNKPPAGVVASAYGGATGVAPTGTGYGGQTNVVNHSAAPCPDDIKAQINVMPAVSEKPLQKPLQGYGGPLEPKIAVKSASAKPKCRHHH